MFSARFDKQDQDHQVLDEIELYKLNINQNETKSVIDNIDKMSQLERHRQNQEMKDSGWRFDENNSRTIYFLQTTEING